MVRSGRNALVVGLLTTVVAFVAVIQVRSQAEVVRSLEGQDNTSLAFLIDDLHRGNDRLAEQAAALSAQRDSLRAGGGTAGAALQEEADRLRVVNGLVPVHGPGVTITVDAPLTSTDLQDAINNLRGGGAEAVAIGDRRVITGSVLKQSGNAVTVDGVALHGPWSMTAIGDPVGLPAAAGLMTRDLRADPRVRSAAYQVSPDLQIRSTVGPRPFVYGSP